MRYTFLILLAMSSTLSAQNLTAKTDMLHLNLSNEAKTEGLPMISWQSPRASEMNSTENRIKLEASLNSVVDVEKVILHIKNAKTGKIIRSRELAFDDSKNFLVSQNLWLPDGTTFIELEAVNADGLSVSSLRKITIGELSMDNLLSIDRRDYALLFATDKYDYWDDLVNPIDDAYAIADVLKDEYGFEVEIVENATVDIVWSKLRDYNERKFGSQDQLMVFFAGHGHYDESFGEGYVVASNSLNNDVARTSYLSHNRLRGVIDNIPCEHILLTMDVCFGGTLDPRIARNRGPKNYEVSVSEMLARKLSKKTRKYLTSGGKEYVSDGIPGQHSPFASKLLQAFKSSGGSDQVLTMSEIQADMENLSQVPRFGSFGADEALSDFVFISK